MEKPAMTRGSCGYRIKIKINVYRWRVTREVPVRPLNQTHETPRRTKPDSGKKPISPFALEKAGELKALLLSDLRHHYSLKALARKLGTNAKTLQEGFKQRYGITIFAFGQDLRLEHGKKLLSEGNLSLQEIAEACGYPEQTNFGVAFKKKFGVGPGVWRKGGIN